MAVPDLLTLNECGLYCPAGGFHIDPWAPVARAVVTHAHSDHARWGMERYLCAAPGLPVMRRRVGDEAAIDTLEYGERRRIGDATVSLHPAGHVLGSAQIRIEVDGEVWVVTGDYKVEPDPTNADFEPIRCHTFVTESTFALPIYRWPDASETFEEINRWWRQNQEAGKASLLLGYALGKAQRLLSGLDPAQGPILAHGAVQAMNDAYREAGVQLPETRPAVAMPKGFDWSKALIIAPPGVAGTPFVRRFGDHSTAFASGWMAIRGIRRRRAMDRGFVMSDHADWPGLLATIRETGAATIWATHGYSGTLARYLSEQGLATRVVPTRWTGEQEEETEDADR
jgi:putative mRNA 3-end processing factor